MQLIKKNNCGIGIIFLPSHDTQYLQELRSHSVWSVEYRNTIIKKRICHQKNLKSSNQPVGKVGQKRSTAHSTNTFCKFKTRSGGISSNLFEHTPPIFTFCQIARCCLERTFDFSSHICIFLK